MTKLVLELKKIPIELVCNRISWLFGAAQVLLLFLLELTGARRNTVESVWMKRALMVALTILLSLNIAGCNKKKKSNGNAAPGATEEARCEVEECEESTGDEASDDTSGEDGSGEAVDVSSEEAGGVDSEDQGSDSAVRKSLRPRARPKGLGKSPSNPHTLGQVKVIYYDELSREAKERLQVVMRYIDSSRSSLKVMAQKKSHSNTKATYQLTDSYGNKFSKKIVSEVYNSHGCSIKNEGYCLVIENNKLALMGVAMGRGLTQVISTKFTNQTREMETFLRRLKNQRVIISPFSHRQTHQSLAKRGARLDRKSKNSGLRVTGICGIEGRLNMSDKGALLVGHSKGTTLATPQFPEQYARISCQSFGKPIRPLRVTIDLEGHWAGVKLQFSAWLKGQDTSYDQWDFGATGLGVISGPLGLLTPGDTSYGLVDLSADLLLGSIAPFGTGVFARKNNNGPNTFVIPFYIKGETGMGDLGAQIEAFSLKLRAHRDEF